MCYRFLKMSNVWNCWFVGIFLTNFVVLPATVEGESFWNIESDYIEYRLIF